VEEEYAPLYEDIGLGTTIWSPLASGVLTGKYNDGVPAGSRLATEKLAWLKDSVLTEERIAKVRKLTEVARELGCTTAQLALAWCLANPHVSSVITGASKKEQVAENMKALAIVSKLDPGVMKRIDAILA
jgi:aryl-alcohol dehydrogenase-like predicted oxidoreductase